MRESRKLLINKDQTTVISERHKLNWHLKQIARGGIGLLGLTAIGGLGYSALGFFRRRSDRISSKATPQIMGQIESGRELSGSETEEQSDTLAIRDFAARKSGVNRQLTDITSNPTKTGLATTEQEKLVELGAVDFHEPTKLKESIATLSYPASCFAYASSINQTTDGGYIVAGAGNCNFLILKLNSTGDIAWAKTFGDSTTAYSIQQTTDDGYIAAGTAPNPASYNTAEAFVLKLDESGNKVWTKTFSDTIDNFAMVTAKTIQQTTDGGYIVAGTSRNHMSFTDETLVLKLDESGNKIWAKTFNKVFGETFTGFTPTSIQQTTDGGYVVLGNTSDYFLILKLDSTGNQVWAKTLVCSSFLCSASSIQQTIDGGYIATGGIYGYQDFPCYVVIVLKLDSAGNKAWIKTFGYSHCDGGQYANSIQQTTDGGYVVAGGISRHVSLSIGKTFIFKLDSTGNTVWAKSFGSAYEEEIFSIRQIADGGYIAAGVVYEDPYYAYAHNWAFILKLDANGIAARAGCGGQDISWNEVNAISFTVEDAALFVQETSLTQASADYFTLDVWDQPETIIICPSELTLTANTLTIGEGGSVILTTANINVGEQKQSASNLTISISNIQHGQFERISSAGIAITSFNLQELQESQIRFVHDGETHAPSYAVQISHEIETTVPTAATINFELSLWLTFGLPCAVVAAVVGCAGGMMRKHSHKTLRNNFSFADYLRTALKLPKVNNFYSKAGRSYINMIYGVPTEADDWTMGDIKVDDIAIKLDSLLYKLHQKKVYQLPLTLPQERALAEIVSDAIHEILTEKPTLANIQEQLEAIVNKTLTLARDKKSANSTLLMLSRMPDANRPAPREEQVGLLARNITDPVQRYMRSGMVGDKAGEKHAPLLRLGR
jgi:hypothetical protein